MPKTTTSDAPNGEPYSVKDLTKAMSAHLHPLMVRYILAEHLLNFSKIFARFFFVKINFVFQERKLLANVVRHLRSGADSLETLSSQIYVSGENLMALAHHCESQSEAHHY